MYSSIYRVQSSTRRLPIRALFGFTLKQVESYSLPLSSERPVWWFVLGSALGRLITALEMARWHPADKWQPCRWWELDLRTMEDLLKKNPFCNLTDTALGLIFHSNYVHEPNTHVFRSFSLEEIHDAIMNSDFRYCKDILCILSCVCKRTIFRPAWQDFCRQAAASTMVHASASRHFPTW